MVAGAKRVQSKDHKCDPFRETMVLLIKQALALSGTGCCSKIQRMGLEAVGLWLQNLESISNPPTLCIATQLSLGECVRSIVEIPASKQLLTALANLGSAFG